MGGGILILSTFLVAGVLMRDRTGWGGDPGAVLPAGESFAFLTGIDADGLHVDLAEMLSGEEARRAAIEDGVLSPGDELPNGFYIRNHGPGSEGVVAEEAVYTVLVFDSDGEISEREISHGLLVSIYENPEMAAEVYGFVPEAFPVTITVEDGVITGFSQVYLP